MTSSARFRGMAVVAAAYGAGFVWFGLRPGLAEESHSTDLATRALIAFLLPTTAAVLLWLFSAISRRSAWGSDPAECAATERILLRCVIFIAALQGLIILRLSEISWLRLSAARLALVLFGALLVSVGNLLPTTRPNLLVGIRTARSLRCRRLWMELHRIGGYATVGVGTIVIVAPVVLGLHIGGQVISIAIVLALWVVTARYRRLARDYGSL
jgi:uncharacterized membrane protein